MQKPKFYSSTVVYYTGGLLRKPIKFKRSSSGIVIGAFRSILLLTILMLNKQIFSVGCFWQSKNTISFVYTIPNCTEEQQYIILLWSTILWNFGFHWQPSILVKKIPLLWQNSIQVWKFLGGLEPPLPLPLLRACDFSLYRTSCFFYFYCSQSTFNFCFILWGQL